MSNHTDTAADRAPSQNDANGQCIHCGRDNSGYEELPCSDECPQYWEAAGIAHPEYSA